MSSVFPESDYGKRALTVTPTTMTQILPIIPQLTS
jgi:hypothetical protein